MQDLICNRAHECRYKDQCRCASVHHMRSYYLGYLSPESSELVVCTEARADWCYYGDSRCVPVEVIGHSKNTKRAIYRFI